MVPISGFDLHRRRNLLLYRRSGCRCRRCWIEIGRDAAATSIADTIEIGRMPTQPPPSSTQPPPSSTQPLPFWVLWVLWNHINNNTTFKFKCGGYESQEASYFAAQGL
ncbi:hypothetical protein QYF36_004388 [Acer negundo]|nr:hypothetical protein QYF36_004388 [Acer negundo]